MGQRMLAEQRLLGQSLPAGCRGFADLPPHTQLDMPALSPTMSQVRAHRHGKQRDGTRSLMLLQYVSSWGKQTRWHRLPVMLRLGEITSFQ